MDIEDTRLAGESVDSPARRVAAVNLAEILDREYLHGLIVGLILGLIGATLIFGRGE